MSGQVLPFRKPAPQEPTEPHAEGEAFCMGCNHTWRAVVPVGTTDFECPNCHAMKGQFRFDYSPPGGMVWEHHCGNQLFNITEDGTFCPRCGEYLRF